jgi:hypothetical protein
MDLEETEASNDCAGEGQQNLIDGVRNSLGSAVRKCSS